MVSRAADKDIRLERVDAYSITRPAYRIDYDGRDQRVRCSTLVGTGLTVGADLAKAGDRVGGPPEYDQAVGRGDRTDQDQRSWV